MMIKKIKVALGIITRKVLTGPIEVSVDLTRRCSLDCLMCWYWSPLLKEHPSSEWASQKIDYELFKELIQDFKKLHVKRVILGGQGEPFLYPELLEAIEITKKAGIEVALITCGAYFNEKKIRAIFDLKVDSLDVSLQAATTETYLKIHPSQREDLFKRIKDWLILLSELKKCFNRTIPKVSIVDAICRLNYQETVKMVDLAKEVGAESVCFKRIDVIPETKELLLTEQEVGELKILLNEAEKKAMELEIGTGINDYLTYVLSGLTTGVYTAELYTSIPCYVGWRSARILANGDVIPCCGCYDIILGNITNSSFITIWNSKKYRQFRQQSINIQKDTKLFKRCKCYSCTDHTLNLAVYQRLHPIKAKKISKEVRI